MNPYVICRMSAGWLVVGDVQPRPGYCLLLADPVVPSLNDLSEPERIVYGLDVARIGDALLAVTGAYRINYETLGNTEPALHTHMTPRYMSEPTWRRRLPPALAYPKVLARRFDFVRDVTFVENLRRALGR